MMLHHVSVGARDVPKAVAFYDKVLAPLGYKRVMEFLPHAVGYGVDHPDFWVQVPADGGTASVGNGVHISFAASSKSAVNAFHAAALKAGGKDEGAPGPRPDYGPDYYGAFCRDLDGNKIEAVVVAMTLPAKTKKASAKKAKPAARKAKPAAKAKRKAKRR
jgi:catechol 2,3-dioxygenase-like lactoylglutathione lyase family enzyme